MRIRRRPNWFAILGVFVAVFLFTFLVQRFNSETEVDAANMAGFDPGYIISDYQMGNYNSMNEAQIQAFLTSKNSCANNNYNYYVALSSGSRYTWHWANGHFVCLSEERFGDGEAIGSGDTAAHIIWQAAQDYRINPQVLIVLLQKETGLITDPIPNNGDYRKATGYGCPDTAPCSAEYYGFKNQVRRAAALFRTVLDGGWTNYPLGNNYVKYNPNAACGGTVINIRSRATSALYRYTPYQPNAAALSSSYGYGDSCSAYGNRNFYSYFQDWFGGITATQSNTRVPDGVYYVQSAKDSSMVLDVVGGSSENGSNIQLFQKNNTSAQQWEVTYNSATDDYNIINLASRKSLDVAAAGVSDGTNIQLWDSNGTCAQRWKIVRTSGDEIKILSSCSFKALDVSAGNIVSGSNIQLWVDNATNAQKWKLTPVEAVADGLYYVVSSMDGGRVVDVSGGSHNAKNGTNVQLWKKNYTAAQQWYIKRGSDGYYTIKNLQSGKFIDVAAAGVEDKTNLQIWDGNGTCAQKWKILKVGQNYEFISACSIKILDLDAASIQPGTNVQIYSANNSMAQKWVLEPVEILKDGEYLIYSRLTDNKVVDIFGNKEESGTNIQLYEFNNTSAQKWEISYSKDDGFYTIFNKKANKVLDVAMAAKNNGANVQTWERNGTCAQKWLIVKMGDDYGISSACSGLMLDVSAAKTDNGTNIQIYESNNTRAQKWQLTEL